VGIEPAPTETGEPEPYRRRMAEGWHFLRREPVLLGLSLMVAATNLLDLAWVAVLLPVWARDSGRTAAAIGLGACGLRGRLGPRVVGRGRVG